MYEVGVRLALSRVLIHSICSCFWDLWGMSCGSGGQSSLFLCGACGACSGCSSGPMGMAGKRVVKNGGHLVRESQQGRQAVSVGRQAVGGSGTLKNREDTMSTCTNFACVFCMQLCVCWAKSARDREKALKSALRALHAGSLSVNHTVWCISLCVFIHINRLME